MDDPILTNVAQPLVDATGVDPRAAAVQGSAAFLACALTLAAVRVATIDGMLADQAMMVVGAGITAAWMRMCAGSEILCRIPPYGLLHLGFRLVLAGCAAFDLVELAILATAEAGSVLPIQFLRSGLQLALDALGSGTFYLTICRRPPPRRRREGLRPSTA